MALRTIFYISKAPIKKLSKEMADLCVAGEGSLQQSVMYEDILVLRLDHVVTLGTQAGHVAVHVHGLLVLHPLQHGVDDYEGPCPPNPRTANSITIALLLT